MQKIKDFDENVSGYVLKFIPSTKKWQIQSHSGVFEGDLLKIWQKMVFQYEMPNGDIRYAIQEMEKKDHNVSEFGILGGFLFTRPN